MQELLDEQEARSLSWSSLPTEVLLVVFRQLGERDLLSCSLVCFHWCSCARVGSLWMSLLSRTLPDVFKLRRRGIVDWFSVVGPARAADKHWGVVSSSNSRVLASQGRAVVDFVWAGRDLVSCGLGKTLLVTHADGGRTTELPGHEHHVCALTATPLLLAAASYDATISLWDPRLYQRVGVLAGHSSAVLDARVVSAAQLISRSRDGSLRLWDVERLKSVSTFKHSQQTVTGVKVLDFNRAVSCSRDGSVALWDMRQHKPIFSEVLHTCDVYAIHVPRGSPDSVFSCSADGSIVCLDLIQKKLASRVVMPEVPYIVKTDGNLVFASGGGGGLMVFENGSALPPSRFPLHDGVASCLRVVNHRVVTGGLDGLVGVWERAVDAPLRFNVAQRLPGRHGSAIVRKIRADVFSIQTGGYDGRVVDSDFRPQSSKPQSGCTIS